LGLRKLLRERPVIYEVVPPRRDPSRFNTELGGLEGVLHDPRIAAVNIPELINRKEGGPHPRYSPATIPPEDYALMIKEYKEPMVNIVAPRMSKDDLLRRAMRVLHEYGIPNIVFVGKERSEDLLPGPSVPEALRALALEKVEGEAFGGICIFTRKGGRGGGGRGLTEAERVMGKAEAGCDFVTSQIIFDAEPALEFLSSYQRLCDRTGNEPVTVFVSVATVPSKGILSLMERLDVVIPAAVKKRLIGSSHMGRESMEVAAEAFRKVVTVAESRGISVPLGLQIEQVGVSNDTLSLDLLDETFPVIKG
jgi:5,10-methylenetetrahydrofolate reductase